jgi:hypothetical protein
MNASTSSSGAAGAGSGAPDKRAFRLHPKLWIAAALLLAFPVVAMLTSREIVWSAEDFIAMGLMLGVLCSVIEAALHWLTALRWRIGAMTLTVLLVLTLWVHLAAGLFD